MLVSIWIKIINNVNTSREHQLLTLPIKLQGDQEEKAQQFIDFSNTLNTFLIQPDSLNLWTYFSTNTINYFVSTGLCVIVTKCNICS